MRSGGIFDYEGKSERLTEVMGELADPSVWTKPDRAQELGRERTKLEVVVGTIDRMTTSLGEAAELLDMAESEGDDEVARTVEHDLTRAGLLGIDPDRIERHGAPAGSRLCSGACGVDSTAL